MSDTTLDATFAPPAPPPLAAFVPRDEQTQVLAAAMAVVRQTEGARRWNLAVGSLAGWAVAALIVVPFGITLAALKDRPVPQDRIFVSVIRADGSQETAQVQDLNPSQAQAAATQFIYSYVENRASYTWESIKRNYDRVQAVTFGPAKAEYTADMTEKEDRPTVTLGQVGTRNATVQSVSQVGPNAWEVLYEATGRDKNGQPRPTERRRVVISTATLSTMPAAIASRFDPLKLVVTQWNDQPAVFNPRSTGGVQ